MTMTRTQWQRTLDATRSRISSMTPCELMFLKAWCFTMFDAIDGPCNRGPDWDAEGDIKRSRDNARDSVVACDFDFTFTCDCAGIDANAVSDAFKSGVIERGDIRGVFKMIRPE